jgi:hypothetical protein
VNGTRHYDAAIIGTGQGGKPLAAAMAAGSSVCRRAIRRFLLERLPKRLVLLTIRHYL